jgi:hypothetical protein
MHLPADDDDDWFTIVSQWVQHSTEKHECDGAKKSDATREDDYEDDHKDHTLKR